MSQMVSSQRYVSVSTFCSEDELNHQKFSEIGKIVFPLYRLHCLSARGRGGGCYLDDLDLDAVLYVKAGNSSFTKSFILTPLSDRVLKKIPWYV